MKLLDYLLIRTPVNRMDDTQNKQLATAGHVSGVRIILSIIGILAGIFMSFYVTGVRPANSSSGTAVNHSQAVGTTASPTPTPRQPEPQVNSDFSLNRLLKVGLIALVLCGISYQGLYFSLRLYEHEPAWLILFISFQYGYFWQTVVKGVQALT